jgi:uncharacterized protein YbcC (UPF0753/DUF2309 family)
MSTILAATTAPAVAPDLAPAVAAALSRIPPLWPLKHFVAVNPFVGLLDRPFAEACALLQRSVGAAPLQSPADYLAALRAGTISPDDLAAVAGPGWSAARLVSILEKADASAAIEPIATVADLLDQERPRAHWSVFVVEEIAKYCAVAFDENQTTWNSPWKTFRLYASWRDAAAHDRNPESFGLAGFRAFVKSLPAEADACIAHCAKILDPQHLDLTDFFHRQLATISGWAGYVQYLVREDALRGRANPALRELLAIRLAYDAALHQAFARDGVFRADWRHQTAPATDATLLEALVRWQSAYEHGFQRRLALSLAAAPSHPPITRPSAQAVFCIDVRSEVFRRHLEAALPGAQTIGFAGFFGFPVAHRPAGASEAASRCPVLLVPPVESCEPLSPAAADAATHARAEAGAWKAFQNSAASCFSFVETAGLAFGAALAKGAGKAPSCSRVAPGLAAASPETRAALAEGALRNMSLVRNFARLVLVCGHGSQSANNPYASALDCGACGGHAGDVNARLAAATLNDPAVRAVLAARGIEIPADTVFVAGLHDTLSDDVALFDLEQVPASHRADLRGLRAALASAGAAARRERAPSLGLAGTPDARLDAAVRARATDISQVRPEWGLANNAALVAAPRSRSAGLKLEGRVFLHDYDASLDPENKVLTLILCAPVVVASWINLQYYASRVDPRRYGAGNKVLHHVVGGLGVMEGNSGDLKVGLPLQSIHDGEKFVHEPRRLTVYIDVAHERIDAVLAAQPAVKQLFDHGWISLIALEGGRARRYATDGWRAV